MQVSSQRGADEDGDGTIGSEGKRGTGSGSPWSAQTGLLTCPSAPLPEFVAMMTGESFKLVQ